MYEILLVFFLNINIILCRPQESSLNHSSISSTTPVGLISSTEYFDANGNFNYSFQTSNGINVSQSGYRKHINFTSEGQSNNNSNNYEDDILVIEGSYSYTAPNGILINITYIADQNGFQPEGDSIPKTTNYNTRTSSQLRVGATDKPSTSSIKTTTPIPIIPNPPNA